MCAGERIGFEQYRERIVQATSAAPLVSTYVEAMFYNLSQLPSTLPVLSTIKSLFDDLTASICDHAIGQAGKIEIDLKSPTFKKDFANAVENLYVDDFLNGTSPFMGQINAIKERIMGLSPRADDRLFRHDMGMCVLLIAESAILAIKGFDPDIIRRTSEEIADAQAELYTEFYGQTTIVDPDDVEPEEVVEEIAERLEKDRKEGAN